MEQSTKDRLSDRSIWVRILYMLIFVVAYAVAEAVLTVVIVFQFLAALITGRVNEALHQFGANLSVYVLQILQFATFNDERLPFPTGPTRLRGRRPGQDNPPRSRKRRSLNQSPP